jgi:hypothetical protein
MGRVWPRHEQRGLPLNAIVRHQMAQRRPASFLNLDLELNSRVNLSRLSEHLDRTTHVLYNGRIKGGYRLSAEPVIRGKVNPSPSACTQRFLDILEKLPTDLAKMFERCKSRVFDYGFDGGLESRSLAVSISNKHLSRIASLGIEIRVTVYPHRKASDA